MSKVKKSSELEPTKSRTEPSVSQNIMSSLTFGKKNYYYIGTLVTFHKGDQVYELIDGQQRLTTINLVLGAMDISCSNKLAYRARKKSNDTIKSIPDFEI